MASWLLRPPRLPPSFSLLLLPASSSPSPSPTPSSGPPTLPCMSQDVLGGPPGFYFQATLRMSEKQHGAARETQHAGGALLASFRAPGFFILPRCMAGRERIMGTVGACACLARCSVSSHWAHLPALAECSACPCFFEVEECQLRSRRKKRRVEFSKCQARGFSRWEEEKVKMKEEEEEERAGVGGEQFLI